MDLAFSDPWLIYSGINITNSIWWLVNHSFSTVQFAHKVIELETCGGIGSRPITVSNYPATCKNIRPKHLILREKSRRIKPVIVNFEYYGRSKNGKETIPRQPMRIR